MSEPETLVGIFDADGGLRGELRYVIDKLAGRGHCALCDITHGLNPLGKRSFKEACTAAGVTMTLLHRDEASPEQLAAAGELPAVLVCARGTCRVLISAGDLAACEGNPTKLLELAEKRLENY
ncbi:MAG: hypothetical protein F4062_07870 [Acidimicrobiia bacterium]|nr:hypothetical protein [Acidimicrobiia bacterium]